MHQELLQLATKAAGLRVGREPNGKECGRYDLYWSLVHNELVWHNKSTGSEYPEPVFWNPITNDGDAFRLMILLDLHVMVGIAKTPCGFSAIEYSENDSRDANQCTRLAITRAAAYLGKQLC